MKAPRRSFARLGKLGVSVRLSAHPGSSKSYLLQKWSTTWNTYVDVEDVDDLEDKDRVTVVQMPTMQSPKSAKVGI